jgi:ABC-type multidrug transport system fused ATPase/permease subunit
VRLIVTTALIGLLVVLLAVMIAVAGLLVVHRLVPLSIRESNTAAIGVIYAALYVMFGMMVGFSAYIVLNKYNTSQSTVKSEASNVEELYWLAEQLPEPERDEIQDLTVSYAQVVVDEEWPLMKGGQTSPQERSRTISDAASRISSPAQALSKRSMLRSWSGFTI